MRPWPLYLGNSPAQLDRPSTTRMQLRLRLILTLVDLLAHMLDHIRDVFKVVEVVVDLRRKTGPPDVAVAAGGRRGQREEKGGARTNVRT